MLERCMETLQREQRDSVLAYYEGYTHSELAKKLKARLGSEKLAAPRPAEIAGMSGNGRGLT